MRVVQLGLGEDNVKISKYANWQMKYTTARKPMGQQIRRWRIR